MARQRFEVPIKKNQSFTLNITSMTDMFTILLVFLLQNFAAEVAIDPVEGLRLPSSTSEKNPVFAVKLAISPTALKFEDKTIAKVEDNKIEQAAVDGKDSNFIKPLFDQLQEVNKKDDKIAKSGKVLLQADKDLPYTTLRKVMYTASMAGFPNVKLVTTAGN